MRWLEREPASLAGPHHLPSLFRLYVTFHFLLRNFVISTREAKENDPSCLHHPVNCPFGNRPVQQTLIPLQSNSPTRLKTRDHFADCSPILNCPPLSLQWLHSSDKSAATPLLSSLRENVSTTLQTHPPPLTHYPPEPERTAMHHYLSKSSRGSSASL